MATTRPTLVELREALEAATTDSERVGAMQNLAQRLYDVDVDEALALADASRSLAEGCGDAAGVATGLLVAGIAHWRAGDGATSIERLEEARRHFELLDDVRGTTTATGYLGNARFLLGEITTALGLFRDACSLAESIGDAESVNCWSLNVAATYEQLGAYDRALECFAVTIEQARSMKNTRVVMNCLTGMASVHFARGEYPEAIEGYLEAIALAAENDFRRESALNRGIIGNVLFRLGDYESALAHYEAALPLHEALEDRAGIARMIGNIGNVLYQLERFDAALPNYLRAVELFEALGDRAALAGWMNNLGNVCKSTGDRSGALEWYEKALQMCRASGVRSIELQCLGNIGDVHEELGDDHRALEYYQAAFELAEELGDRPFASYWRGAVATIYGKPSFERHDPVRAEAMLRSVVETSTEIGDRDSLRQYHEWLSRLYQQQGRWQEAHQHTVAAFTLRAELQNLEAHRKAQQVEHRRKIAEFEKQRAIELAESRREAEMMEAAVKRQQETLSKRTLQVAQQTEMLESLRRELEEIMRHAESAETALRKIRVRLRELPQNVLNWDRFEQEFVTIHPRFIERVRELVPSLSPAELKVCCLLRIGMTSREIATLLFLSERTVEVHRMRIRRKLLIEGRQSMQEALAAIVSAAPSESATLLRAPEGRVCKRLCRVLVVSRKRSSRSFEEGLPAAARSATCDQRPSRRRTGAPRRRGRCGCSGESR